jgi:hypothetical protein
MDFCGFQVIPVESFAVWHFPSLKDVAIQDVRIRSPQGKDAKGIERTWLYALNPVVTRAAGDFRTNRIIEVICPLMPPRFLLSPDQSGGCW